MNRKKIFWWKYVKKLKWFTIILVISSSIQSVNYKNVNDLRLIILLASEGSAEFRIHVPPGTRAPFIYT